MDFDYFGFSKRDRTEDVIPILFISSPFLLIAREWIV